MKINNTGLGEKLELVTELKTRDDYMNFCLENGAVGGCAKNKTEVRQANKDRLIEMTKWICDNYMTYLEYSKENANMTRNDMINEMKGNSIIVSYNWLRENDTETLAYIQESNYCDFKEEETVLEVQFDEGGTRYYACAEWADCETPSQNQPEWWEDSWEDWETKDIQKHYNEFKNQ